LPLIICHPREWKVIVVIEASLIELAKGIGGFFLNPFFYWFFILLIGASYIRIKRERSNFGTRVFPRFSELGQTWAVTLIFGLAVSLISLAAGIVLTYEIILVLSIVMIILSLTFKFTMLSASYTIGITYLLFLFLPMVFGGEAISIPPVSFAALSLLLGIFLMAESILLRKTKRNRSFPQLAMSSRGGSIGLHQLKKIAFIPFFTLVPSGLITSFAPFWPAFSIGGESYSLILIPFAIGFHFNIKSMVATQAARVLSKNLLFLSAIVILIAVSSIFIPELSLVAVLLAILGREWVLYRFRVNDGKRAPYFTPKNKGLVILSVIPDSRADQLGLADGETISKVNGNLVRTPNEFYKALQTGAASYKLEVLDENGEIRLVQGVQYEQDHHELGLIFPEQPFRTEAQDQQYV